MNDPYDPAGSPGQAPAGWYPDPVHGGQRWWDGRSWGPHAPAAPAWPDAYAATAAVNVSQDRTWAMWSHLGPLLVGVGAMLVTAGVLSIFAFAFPLVVLNTVGSRSPRVRAHAVESLNFQLSILLYYVSLLLVTTLVAVVTLGFGLVVMLPALVGLGVFEVVVMIIASVQASNGGFYRYPLNIRFIR